MNTTDWLGFIGVFLILLAYILNELGKTTNKSLLFILLNLIGASIACLASILLDYLPFIILEGVWALVSLNSFINYLKQLK
ncbi:MAG: hypothetical protein GQ540_08035 [Lutibacter sp.]|uniref:CBU_0592 family membrane protein n=1 Tax=Lutibacter sp. TaxID=1925666 RepID=UPI0019E0D5D2|nr:hypothetical protein [Lutibacter sp.]NOR28461.1 hypothetical protein [Lutibacter sp.]